MYLFLSFSIRSLRAAARIFGAAMGSCLSLGRGTVGTVAGKLRAII